MRWWRDLSGRQKIAIVAAAGIGATAGVVIATRQASASSKLGRLFPSWPWLHPFENLAGFDAEESDEPEPEGIVYDEDDGAGPCRSPAVPWNVPVSSSFGGKVSEEFCIPPADLEPIAQTDVAFAEGGLRPKWPLKTSDPQKLKVSYQDVRELWHGRHGRRFGATRHTTDPATGESYKRVHVGVDLFADPGDVVLAPEDGVVIAALPFYKGLGALYLKTDSGIVVNLGEIQDGSWHKYGIASGDLSKTGGHRVVAGQPVAKVGTSNDGSHMLHLETYSSDATVDEIRHKKMRWLAGEPAPAKVLDPTRYLVRAQRVYYEDTK